MASLFRPVKVGTTDVSIFVRVVDSTDGTPETGVAFNTAGVDLWYRRDGAARVAITEATLAAVDSAHSDGGFIHISDGECRLDLPDAACASGAAGVLVGGTFTSMVVISTYVPLVAYDPYDTVRLGLTALPNAAADAAGGLPISDAGGLDLDAQVTTKINAILADTGTDGVVLSTSTQESISDKVWDEAASAHVAAGSFGQRLGIIRANTAQAGDATHITLDASASAVNDFYNNQQIFITAGTGVGQGRIISDYVGATKVAEVATWATNPSSDSVFVITPFGSIPGASAPTAGEVADAVWDEALSGHTTSGTAGEALGGQILRTATAQAGGASSITLDASASATNDLYNYNIIRLIGGTGAGQSRQISDYVGASKVATVSLAWTTQPSSDSVFQIIALGVDAATVAAIADGVWDEARAGHVAAGSFGEYVLADATRLSGDATAADNAESFFDGTGYAGTGNVIPTVTTVTTVSGLAANSVTASALATDAVNELVDQVWREAIADHSGTAGSTAAALSDVLTDTGTTLQAELDGIQADTEDIQTRLPAALVNSRMDSTIDGTGAEAAFLAAINAEIVDALATDTYAEPGQGTPAATATLAAKVNYLYKAWRNRSTQTATQYSLYADDATTVDQKAAVSDDATTFSRGELATGP